MVKAETEIKQTFHVKNEKGLHTRPATEIVQCLRAFASEVFFTYNDKRSDAKSVLGLLMLAAPFGAEIEISATGEDAQAAIDAVVNLSLAQFNVNY